MAVERANVDERSQRGNNVEKRAKAGSSRPEKSPVKRGSEKDASRASNRNEPSLNHAKALTETLGRRDLIKSLPSNKELMRLMDELGTNTLQINYEDGRATAAFMDGTGRIRYWSDGPETVSVHEVELGNRLGRRSLGVQPTGNQAPRSAPTAKATATTPRNLTALNPISKVGEQGRPSANDDKWSRSSFQRTPIEANGRNTVPKPHCEPVPYPPEYSRKEIAQLGERKALEFKWNPFSKYAWFRGMVTRGGELDFKHHYKPADTYEPTGNYNYGFLGAALEIPEKVLLNAAGAYQVKEAAVRLMENAAGATKAILTGEEFTPKKLVYEFSWLPFIGDSRGDDPRDQLQIKCGIEDYRNLYRQRSAWAPGHVR